MIQPRQISLSRLLVIIGGVAIIIGVASRLDIILEREFWRVHPSEREIAQTIREDLGGAYHSDGDSSWHITGVWLKGSNVGDADIESILKLQHLERLDISNTQVTDAALTSIFSHSRLRIVALKGTRITRAGLATAIRNGSGRIAIED